MSILSFKVVETSSCYLLVCEMDLALKGARDCWSFTPHKFEFLSLLYHEIPFPRSLRDFGKGVELAWTEVTCPHQYPAIIELSPPIISLKKKTKQNDLSMSNSPRGAERVKSERVG